jgi:NADH-quinone oxidoreductase subunit L
MFHLTTHAFFKALLFLGSGSVIHGCHGEQDIFKMGGLASRMKFTFATFTVGVGAIIGLPFLAGFYSKDAILALAFANNRGVFAVLSLTAVLTGIYMLRLWLVTFLGAARSEAAGSAHEGGMAMGAPLAALALLAAVGGYFGLHPGAFSGAFAGVFGLVHEAAGAAASVILATSLGILLAAVGISFAVYRPARASAAGDAVETGAPDLFAALVALKDSFDRVYDYFIRKIQQRLAMLLNFIDIIGLAGLLIRGGAGLVGMVGLGARALHVGRLSSYVYWFLAGVVVLWLFASGVL